MDWNNKGVLPHPEKIKPMVLNLLSLVAKKYSK
jgi:hypothetical protein